MRQRCKPRSLSTPPLREGGSLLLASPRQVVPLLGARVGSGVGVVEVVDLGLGSTWRQGAFNQPQPASLRYAIDRDSDLDQIFDIDADTGAIVTGKGLDRETAGWHNITVLAMEAGEPGAGRRPGGGAKRKKPAQVAGLREAEARELEQRTWEGSQAKRRELVEKLAFFPQHLLSTHCIRSPVFSS